MADTTGPCSTLPGARHDLPEGATCDQHPDVPAVARVQGETDSFGSELNDMCQECLGEHRAYMRSAEAHAGTCDWCKRGAADLRPRRDYEEGLGGPVYDVCGACVKRENDELEKEAGTYWDDYGDD